MGGFSTANIPLVHELRATIDTQAAEIKHWIKVARRCDDRAELEKQRRVYYQDIVYSVCNTLDAALGLKIVCGTLDSPATECQDAASVVVAKLTRLREVVEKGPKTADD